MIEIVDRIAANGILGLPALFLGGWRLYARVFFPSTSRIAPTIAGILLAAGGVGCLALFAADQPNWVRKPIVYCRANGGVAFAASGVFGRTDAIVCRNGTAEPYRGSIRWVREQDIRL